MPIARRYFLHFIANSSGLCGYLDNNGNVQWGNVTSGIDYSLPQSPDGWADIVLSFGRSAHYWGLTRTFTVPLKFVGDGATIVRSALYTGRGIESPLTLVVLKWDDVTGIFRLYYSGLLDLSQASDLVEEGVTVNIMEGGAAQYIKSYENTQVEIPCNGSIPCNLKILDDGIEFTDTFLYQILNTQSPYAGDQPVPMAFVSNSGDNIGVTHSDQQLDNPYAGYYQKSTNFCFTSVAPITGMKITGQITVLSDFRVDNTSFYIHTATSLSQPVGLGGNVSNAVGLVLPALNNNDWEPAESQLTINGQVTFAFSAEINLAANENLFFFFFNNFAANPVTIVGGQIQLTFNSRYISSRIWGMTAYDLGQQIVQALNALSSNFLQTFNLGFNSTFLQSKLNWVVTSGDAIRASTDPEYYQYFNQATVNPDNPTNQFYEQFSFQGPGIKTSLADLFDAINPIGCCALGNQLLAGMPESIFLEAKSYVLDSSVITMSLNKISNFRVSVALEYYFNWLEIGYPTQQYDEKAGKYEYNCLFSWQAPIKTIVQKLSLVSKYRTDSYGIEYTRWNTQGGKSTTFNNSDNSVFLMNVDLNDWVYDFYSATFISGVPDPTSPTNTDQKLIVNKAYQPLYCATLNGEYWVSNNDFSIFIINYLVSASPSAYTVNAGIYLNGLVGDSATVTMWINGVNAGQWNATITEVNTPLNIAFAGSRVWAVGDCIYFTIDTVRTCTGTINSFQLNVSGYFTAYSTGADTVNAGQSQQLISLPVVAPVTEDIDGVAVPVVSYGFQYFQFLSPVHDSTFTVTAEWAGYYQGGAGDTTQANLWRQGVIIGSSPVVTSAGGGAAFPFNQGATPGQSAASSFYSLPLTFAAPPPNTPGLPPDLIWMTGSVTNMSSWVSYISLVMQSGTIKAYALNRPAYTNVSGIPNPASAFNIPDFTPKQMLLANGSILSPVLYTLSPSVLSFQTTDKNQFLATTLDGVTTLENANINIHDLAAPAFLPWIFEFDTEVPINFADLLNYAANGHIEFTYNGVQLYGFPIQVSAKPAFNESQSWKLLCSPKTNLANLVDLEDTGLVQLQLMDASIPIVSTLHFVPLGYTKASVYKNYTMDQDWYQNRIKLWIDQSNYLAPLESDEVIPLQCQTNGLSPVSVQLLDQYGHNVGAPLTLPVISDPAVVTPQTLFQGGYPLTGLQGTYYMLWSMGTGPATAVFISEGFNVQPEWDQSTIRIDATNSTNKIGAIFSSGYAPFLRLPGQINRYVPKSKFTTFVDQPQDIDLLNAIPYDTWTLEVGRGSGLPDYLMRKIDRFLLLDTVFIDGDQYSRDADAQWEVQTFPGQAKTYMTLAIRRALNEDSITLNTSGQLDTTMSGGYTLDASAFGSSNSGQNLIEVAGS
jgi:hypothetical protein